MGPGLSASASLKLVLLLASGISHQIVVTSPNPPAEKIARPSFFEKNVHIIVRFVIYPIWLVFMLDIAATVVTAFSGPTPFSTSASVLSHLATILVPPRIDAQALQRPSAPFILSVVLLIICASLRLWCYKTLGSHFRFEVSIQAHHKLITSGPYRIVRHPSYLAAYGCLFGCVVLLASRGAYTRECALAPLLHTVLCAAASRPEGCEAVGKLHAAALVSLISSVMWFVGIAFCALQVAGRLSWEEEVLHKEFGKEWEAYAERVRWRILPGVL